MRYRSGFVSSLMSYIWLWSTLVLHCSFCSGWLMRWFVVCSDPFCMPGWHVGCLMWQHCLGHYAIGFLCLVCRLAGWLWIAPSLIFTVYLYTSILCNISVCITFDKGVAMIDSVWRYACVCLCGRVGGRRRWRCQHYISSRPTAVKLTCLHHCMPAHTGLALVPWLCIGDKTCFE